MRKICDNIARCFPFTTGPRQQAALRDFCNRGHVQCGSRFCVRNPGACGHTDGSNRPGKPGVGKPFIYICLPGFTSACDTGTGNPEAETLLHEMFHYAGSDDGPGGASYISGKCVGGAECRMQRCIYDVLRP